MREKRGSAGVESKGEDMGEGQQRGEKRGSLPFWSLIPLGIGILSEECAFNGSRVILLFLGCKHEEIVRALRSMS